MAQTDRTNKKAGRLSQEASCRLIRRWRRGARLYTGRAVSRQASGTTTRPLPPSPLFPRALRRIAFIVFAQRIGLSLEEIGAELAKASRPPDADAPGLGAHFKAWTKRIYERIDERIAELERLRAGLTRCMGAGRRGPGPALSARLRGQEDEAGDGKMDQWSNRGGSCGINESMSRQEILDRLRQNERALRGRG